MTINKLSAEDKRWRAQDDAYTLMNAEKINSDKVRKTAAIKAAKVMVKDKENEVKAIKKVTNNSTTKKATTKKSSKKK